MKNMKIYAKVKELKGRAALVAAGIATGVLVMGGCTTEVVVTDPVTTEVVTENPEPEIEVIETSEPVEEVVEDKEECEVPEFILYDENGEVYVPQEVTADDIYARIDEITEKYNFANDWERDRVIGILLYRNSYYMSEEDINKIYKDYLANFGGINIMQQAGYEKDDFINKRSKIELKDYYIDERLSAEAEKIEIYIDNDADMTKYKDAFVEAMETVNNDGNDEKYYNPLCNIYESIKLDFTNDEKAIYNQYIDIADVTVYYYVNNYDTLQYQISDYESSHIEKVK